MFRALTPIKLLAVTMTALILLVASDALAANQYVVISSKPHSANLVPGTILKVGDTVDVPDDTTITLLGDDGTVNTFSGPATLVVSEELLPESEDRTQEQTVFKRISDLLLNTRKGDNAVGASRAITSDDQIGEFKSPWTISVGSSDNGCIRRDELLLVRGEAAKHELKVELRHPNGTDVVTWPPGARALSLPSHLASRVEQIVVAAEPAPTTIAIHRLPPDIAESKLLNVLGWMLEAGCDRQALELLGRPASAELQ